MRYQTKYDSFVGLEIHVQLTTESKVFCSCKNNFGDEPNTNICPVCMGLPGSLPSLNAEAMEKAYLVARALNCTLTPRTMFERKNYFYPDLPKNYQISQFDAPLGTNGYIDIQVDGQVKRVRIHECHLEEDAGKMIHAGDMSLVDYNRTGTPLLEIVTEPDMSLGEEAEILMHELRRIVRYLGVSDGNMDEGSMRCDANISLNLKGHGLGRKVEIKNLNSSRFVRLGLNYEIDRQSEILEEGGTVVQETRLWNENRDQTVVMRSKENANDYRYFPEPDLPPFVTDQPFLTRIEERLCELPLARKLRLINDYGIHEQQAEQICEERSTADYFEEIIALGSDPVALATWLSGDVQKLLNRYGVQASNSVLTPPRFHQLLTLLASGKIHGKIAKQILDIVFEEDVDPEQVMKDKGLEQITDPKEIAAIIEPILQEHSKAIEQIRAGDPKPFGFLMGQVMKATAGRAEPQAVQAVLKEMI
ncbi:Asp-tRNA(Asn)/Glu-tRNA(Gln) amidotransferase subunit GatB [Spirochaeta lutea]|uniref:Aspartyl/glutamyl-tRNA(Asn/Gln) amidotransferase subunit B n=1 Tax=Spirochaeta lutea TaxID=1480694 RepID=A0A098QWY5_9SPIO|nr:Asp-tRNA(Asn)/Glu-tRNA(Gln) amidotransferase subunit GatB [Spirochaeta lutea]KGE71908.1 glutamyl-tRNA amidotransferase [Spirochaeta lutea]